SILSGIATAGIAFHPMVVLTGQLSTNVMGSDAFQEADIVGITRPITKNNYLVKDVSNLEQVVREAFHVASSGRPGPVLVDLPKDMITSEHRYSGLKKVSLPSYQPTREGHSTQITRAAELLSNAVRPL